MAGTKKEIDNLEQAVLDMNDPKVQEILKYLNAQAKKEQEKDDPNSARYERLQKSEELRAELPHNLKIFRDGDKYKDDVYVGYNGRDYLIKRGVMVTVPTAVAEIYYRAEQQKAIANEQSKDLQDTFEQKSREV